MYFFLIFLTQIATFGLQFCQDGKFLFTVLTWNCSTWGIPFLCNCCFYVFLLLVILVCALSIQVLMQDTATWAVLGVGLCKLPVAASTVSKVEVKMERQELTNVTFYSIFVQISQLKD